MSRQIKSILITIIVVLFSTQIVTAQSTDEVVLQKPSEGSTISNTYEIEWKIVDADIQDPAYFIDVFNLACSQNGGNLGRITNSGAEVENNIYTYSWDTSSGNLGNSLQNGGNYCMRVCGILADGGSVYSKCDKKSFTFSSETTGTNKPPQITPSKDGFNVTLNEIFSYKVQASDPDGDELKYSFLNAPDFLTIDSKTGQISGKPTEVGDIRFIVKVDDSKGGISTEEFILNIQLTSAEKEVVFEFPKSGSTVTPENNTIKWKVKSGLTVKSLTLSYSSDKEEWTEITKQDRDLGQYTWNISDIEDGEYFIQFLLVDSNNKLYEIFSDGFFVSAQGTVSETEITNLTPEEGSTVNINRPVISAEFKTPDGVTIDTENVSFTLNERIDLTLCEITANSINCEIVSELSNDTYTAFIEITDSEGATLVKEWKFSVDTNGETSEESEDSGGLSGDSMQLILIIFAVGFLLIAIPWSIYLIVKKRRNKATETTKLPDNTVIHPITPINPEPAQPTIGSQGLDLGVQTNPPVVDYQPENQNYSLGSTPVSNNMQPAAGDVYSPTENLNASNIPPVQGTYNQQLPTDTYNSLGTNPSYSNQNINQTGTLADAVFTEPEIVPAQNNFGNNINPTNTQPLDNSGLGMNTEVLPTQATPNTVPANELPNTTEYSFDNPSVIEQPAMYQKDEIPEWLETDIPDTTTTNEQNTGASTMEDVLTKTQIQEGSKVYDPYGLALKTDETEDPDVPPQLNN